jgi:hypothetical protein
MERFEEIKQCWQVEMTTSSNPLIRVAIKDINWLIQKVEEQKKILEGIKEAYEYGQPNHEGEVMVEVEDTCDAMYFLAISQSQNN